MPFVGTTSARLFETNFRKSAAIIGLGINQSDEFSERVLFAAEGQIGKSVKLAKNILRDAAIRGRDALRLCDAERVFRKSNVKHTMTPFDVASWSDVKKELEAIGWIPR